MKDEESNMSRRAVEENQVRSVQNSADEIAVKATEKGGRNRDNVNLLEKERQDAKVKK